MAHNNNANAADGKQKSSSYKGSYRAQQIQQLLQKNKTASNLVAPLAGKKTIHRSTSWTHELLPPSDLSNDPFENPHASQQPSMRGISSSSSIQEIVSSTRPNTGLFSSVINAQSLQNRSGLVNAAVTLPVVNNRASDFGSYHSPVATSRMAPPTVYHSPVPRVNLASESNAVRPPLSTTRPTQPETAVPEIIDEAERSSVASLCFSLIDGRVTSLVSTPDGAYMFAGFSSGSIRVYDLTVGGISGPEDRVGNQVGKLDVSTNSSGALKVHMQIGGYGSGSGNVRNILPDVEVSYSPLNQLQAPPTVPNTPTNCCHLFAGARLGSSSMLIIDIGSLRNTKQKRGFITLAGGGVQVFKRSDPRLKGFTALSTLLVSSVPIDSTSGEYVAKYRLVTGRGFCSYHVWDVLLTATLCTDEYGASTLQYSDTWTMIVSATINGPTLTFAHFVSSRTADNARHSFYSNSSSNGLLEIMSASELLHCCADKEVRSVTLIESDNSRDTTGNEEDLVADIGTEDSRECEPRIDKVATSSSSSSSSKINCTKPVTLKGVIDVVTASANGTILFSGTDELVVSEYLPASMSTKAGQITRRVYFNLQVNVEASVSTSSSVAVENRRASRHLRMIEQVCCTADGAFALILCSDNSVFLYSVHNVLNRGVEPVRVTGSGSSSDGGYLTLLFQCDELHKLELGISYAISDRLLDKQHPGHSEIVTGDDSNLSTTFASTATNGENVLLSVSYWQISSPLSGGVLKTCRLLPYVPSFMGRSVTHSIVPVMIATHGVGLYTGDVVVSNPSAMNTTLKKARPSLGSSNYASKCCLVCGDDTKHWADSDVAQSSHSAMSTAPTTTSNSSSVRRIEKARVTLHKYDVEKEGVGDGEGDSETEDDDGDYFDESRTIDKAVRIKGSVAASKHKRVASGGGDGGGVRLDRVDAEHDLEEVMFVSSKKARVASSNPPTDNATSTSNAVATANTNDEAAALKIQLIKSKDANTALSAEIVVLQNELTTVNNEMNRIMRRADARFTAEMVARRQWNVEKNALNERNAALEREKLVLAEDASNAETKIKNIAYTLKLLTNTITGETTTSANSATVSNSSSSSSSGVNLLLPVPTSIANFDYEGTEGGFSMSNAPRVPSIKAFFCVICQNYNANVVLRGQCGHICLCQLCAITLTNKSDNGRLTKCPLCSKSCDGFISLVGIENV